MLPAIFLRHSNSVRQVSTFWWTEWDSADRLEDYEGAMRDLEAYMKQNSKNPALFYEKGVIQLAMKDTLAAESSFNELLKQDSTNGLGWSAKGAATNARKTLRSLCRLF